MLLDARYNELQCFRTMMVISYTSIICQLSKINIERRNLASYKYSVNVTETVRDNHEMENTTMVTNNTSDTTPAKHPEDNKQMSELIATQVGDVDKKTSWSIYFKSKKFRSYSFKENSSTAHHRPRRLSDFIGLQNINVSRGCPQKNFPLGIQHNVVH